MFSLMTICHWDLEMVYVRFPMFCAHMEISESPTELLKDLNLEANYIGIVNDIV